MKVSVFWFRRDLRLKDNRGLFEAVKRGLPVLPIFIFDTHILDRLEDKQDRRVDYIHQALETIHKELGSGLTVFHGTPLEVFKNLTESYDIQSVFCNEDYEPDAIRRDKDVADFLQAKDIEFKSYKDQVIFSKNDILKSDGTPYTVFTPYSKRWLGKLSDADLQDYSCDLSGFVKSNHFPGLEEIGFRKTDIVFQKPELNKKAISDYHLTRDFPALDATTYLGIALRFGTISVRKCVRFASESNQTWLKELIWREFFMQILFHFPKVVNACFKDKYENIKWRNNEAEFELWCKGETGYPIVDAGMRQLNETGFMHNRVRMIVASFLTKHLLIDWRWGEAYFATKLLDYDLSANNGNWQWAAGCGCDAAPYFRVFNPAEQTRKFDKDLKYIKKWNPDNEFRIPIVEHAFARDRALKVYKEGLSD
jgi:deoxyribodipyrimidine photo-lyase